MFWKYKTNQEIKKDMYRKQTRITDLYREITLESLFNQLKNAEENK